jgi:tRNA pseudouridine65 synthase
VRPALQRVRDQIGQPVYLVHRLDRATSGVLLFALSSEVARDMQGVLAVSDKRYLALCRGHDSQLTQVDHPLAKEPGAERREAVTDFRWLGSFERYGLYEARPRSGRTHQIRRHLKHVSQPIVGDVRYGKGDHNRIFRERFGFHRLALHCQRISFNHPRGAQPIELHAPLDGAFTQLLEAIGLASRA